MEISIYIHGNFHLLPLKYSRPRFKDAHIKSTPRFKDDIFSESKVPRIYTIIIRG